MGDLKDNSNTEPANGNAGTGLIGSDAGENLPPRPSLESSDQSTTANEHSVNLIDDTNGNGVNSDSSSDDGGSASVKADAVIALVPANTSGEADKSAEKGVSDSDEAKSLTSKLGNPPEPKIGFSVLPPSIKSEYSAAPSLSQQLASSISSQNALKRAIRTPADYFLKGNKANPMYLIGDAQATSKTGPDGIRRCALPRCDHKTVPGCAFCRTHGGRKLCEIETCKKFAQAPTNRCKSHGGGHRCRFEGCTKSAAGSVTHCSEHEVPDVKYNEPNVNNTNSSRMMACNIPSCEKMGNRSTYFCKHHGGGKRCNFLNCAKSACGKSSLCVAHGGGKRCQQEKCSKSAVGSSPFCLNHGGVAFRRCNMQSCQKIAARESQFCAAHHDQIMGTHKKFHGGAIAVSSKPELYSGPRRLSGSSTYSDPGVAGGERAVAPPVAPTAGPWPGYPIVPNPAVYANPALMHIYDQRLLAQQQNAEKQYSQPERRLPMQAPTPEGETPEVEEAAHMAAAQAAHAAYQQTLLKHAKGSRAPVAGTSEVPASAAVPYAVAMSSQQQQQKPQQQKSQHLLTALQLQQGHTDFDASRRMLAAQAAQAAQAAHAAQVAQAGGGAISQFYNMMLQGGGGRFFPRRGRSSLTP